MLSDEQFIERLKNSAEGVRIIAQHYLNQGYNVRLPPVKIREKREDWRQHMDECDFFLELPMEVKQISADFTCREDFPYPNVLFSAVHAWDEKKPKPSRVHVLSSSGDYFAMIAAHTSPHWIVKDIFDKHYQYNRKCYACPLEHVQFIEVQQ